LNQFVACLQKKSDTKFTCSTKNFIMNYIEMFKKKNTKKIFHQQ